MLSEAKHLCPPRETLRFAQGDSVTVRAAKDSSSQLNLALHAMQRL